MQHTVDVGANATGDRQAHHAHRSPMDPKRCPYCGSPITQGTLARIAEAERSRVAQVEQALSAKFARELSVAEQKARTAVEAAKRDAAKAAQAQIKALQTNQQAMIAQRVRAAREATEKRLADIIAGEKTKAAEERIRLTEQLADLKRRLEHKTADELGSGAEVDLYKALHKEFGETDKITQVRRGQYGADIIHDVCKAGSVIGRIIYDSKAHARWASRFVSKLKHDMIEHKADHCVLSSTAFPAGARQLHIEAGVVIAAPGRVIALARLLRRQIVQMHTLRLGNEARDTKRDELYEFLSSERANQLLERIGTLTDDMLQLDVKEVSAHQTTWRRRDDLIRSIQRLNVEFTGEVERIIGSGRCVSAEPNSGV
jgi:hypothetical protein